MADDPAPSGDRIAAFHRSRARRILEQTGAASQDGGTASLIKAAALSGAARGDLLLAEDHLQRATSPGIRGDWTPIGGDGRETAALLRADGSGLMFRLTVAPDGEGWRWSSRDSRSPPTWQDEPGTRQGHAVRKWEAQAHAEAAASAWAE